MRVKVIKGDITDLKVDAIVNAANAALMGGGGVDGAIHRAAGPDLAEYCRKLKGCKTGDAKITPGFNLKAKYVIHAVGPVWNNDTENESVLLASVYKKCLEIAKTHQLKSIAFPSISTGAYRFPFEKATKIAEREISLFLENDQSFEEIVLVAYSDKDYIRMKKIINHER